ncbi:alpha/beta hydrolase [Flavihumibacter rivuli]|uniref:alpha/beta hydrolase n=1 Tax=Flavihumibacter rivuli TaxID=2838156 RepID=UPI001BDF38C7|nr:alpha/beta hydrolase [Flavihumibacter rivuli]ULQ55875.1 alpha/beta hydrolase [Flavihumibacter rivuli]
MNLSSISAASKGRSLFFRIGIILVLLILAVFLSFQLSPWPSAMLIRYAFNKGGIKMNKELEKHVPPGVTAVMDLHYDPADKDALLDLYYPSSLKDPGKQVPLIVWFHGGGLISGDKGQVGNYCRILASKGYAVASVDYTIAPEGKFPTPIRQGNQALGYLKANANKYPINASKIFLAGDSGGSMIAAQVANLISDSGYADTLGIRPSIDRSLLAGMLLYCGIYDISHLNFSGNFGDFLRTVLWSYGGRKDFRNHPTLHTASVLNYVTAGFPPSFISAGNEDPLLSQSLGLARKLAALQVQVDTVFYPSSFQPGLPHEYQFNLDIAPGRQVLDRSLIFMKDILSEEGRGN